MTARPLLAGRKVLLVTFGPVLTPDGGLSVRARTTIEALVELGARVAVISHHEPAGNLGPGVELATLRRPLHLGFSWELVRAVRGRARGADLVVVESALFLPGVVAGRPSAPIVWDTNECETLHYQRLPFSLGNRLRGLAWRVVEGWAARRAALTVAISEEEAGMWERLFPRLVGRTVAVAHRAHARAAQPWRPPGGTVLLFVGNTVGKHNAIAARWLTDVLAPRLPSSAVLVLAGQGTDAASGDRVLGLGLVDDIDAVIAGADICLAPLHAGAGVKTKVLHYLAHGKAVIATPAALEGIRGAPGVTEVPMAGFAGAVLAAAGRSADPAEERRRGEEQRAWLAAHHGADVVAAQWREALAPLLAPAMASGSASVGSLARGLRAEVRNWLPLGVLGWVVMPSRCPPRRGLLDRRIAGRPVTVQLRSGERLSCQVAELFAVAEVFALATYDRPGVDWSAARTIVDVGANVGAATVWMARRAPQARILAVEPSPGPLARLRHNVSGNGLDDRVTVAACAIAATSGTLRLARGTTSVSGRVVTDGSANGAVDLVAARTLSSVLADAGIASIDILKLDCEGAEFEIIETMRPDELAGVGAIVGEYHTFDGRQPEELRSRLEAAGFAFTWSGGAEIGTFSAVRSP